MTEVCKVCKKPYTKVNKSHVGTHDGMTWEEYEALGEVEPKPQDTKPVASRWDEIMSTVEWKMKERKLATRPSVVSDKYCIDFREGKICEFCKSPLTESVWMILSDPQEKAYGRPLIRKKPYHKQCAIHEADMEDRLAYVMNPIDDSEEHKAQYPEGIPENKIEEETVETTHKS